MERDASSFFARGSVARGIGRLPVFIGRHIGVRRILWVNGQIFGLRPGALFVVERRRVDAARSGEDELARIDRDVRPRKMKAVGDLHAVGIDRQRPRVGRSCSVVIRQDPVAGPPQQRSGNFQIAQRAVRQAVEDFLGELFPDDCHGQEGLVVHRRGGLPALADQPERGEGCRSGLRLGALVGSRGKTKFIGEPQSFLERTTPAARGGHEHSDDLVGEGAPELPELGKIDRSFPCLSRPYLANPRFVLRPKQPCAHNAGGVICDLQCAIGVGAPPGSNCSQKGRVDDAGPTPLLALRTD